MVKDYAYIFLSGMRRGRGWEQYNNIRISSTTKIRNWLILLVRVCWNKCRLQKGTRIQRWRPRKCCHWVDNNNTSETVLGIIFKSATNFIIPVRVSSDKSKIFENVSIADLMLSNTSEYIDSVLTIHSWNSLYQVRS